MPDDGRKFKSGAVTQPLATGSPNSLLSRADPAIYWALLFYTHVLERYVQPVMVEALIAAGAKQAGQRIVSTAIGYDPNPDLFTQPENRYPLLALYRVSEQYRDRTVVWPHTEAVWRLDYILPEMTVQQWEKISPLIPLIRECLVNRTNRGADGTFEDDAHIWGEDYAGLESIGILDSEWAAYENDVNGLVRRAWRARIAVNERTGKPASLFETFLGADADLDLADPATDTTYSDLVEVNTTQAPTVTAISPATGASAGGTAVTITGTLFRNGATVTIGGVTATGITVASATSITATTPAGYAGSHDVVVTNVNDSQSGTLDAGFAYT